MLKENLHTYRQERKAFIYTLRYFYDIDFYRLDVQDRNAWFHTYLLYKRDFMDLMKLTIDETGCLEQRKSIQRH